MAANTGGIERSGFERTVKALVRHVLWRTGLLRIYRSLRRRPSAYLELPQIGDRFRYIYDQRIWQQKTGATLSGGSDLKHTVYVRSGLAQLLQITRTRVLLDVGCGDFQWMKAVDLPGKYIGVDIVPSLITFNQSEYGRSDRTFLLLDATRDPLPQADTILCRDVLFHLSLGDIQKVLNNFKTSGARFLIATNDDDVMFNSDIDTGDFRFLNLRRSPFRLPPPQHSFEATEFGRARVLALWDLEADSFGPQRK